jgi:hypothetical protein
MSKRTSAPLAVIASTILMCLFSSMAVAGTVEITYENSGTSSNNAGLHELTIDGVSTYAMNSKAKPPKVGKTWTATVNSYEDVQAGAGKFNRKPGDATKYNRTGYLFSYMDFRDELSSSSTAWNAAINEAVWKIMGKKGKLSSLATSIYNYATKGYGFIDNHNWSNSMTVYTATNLRSEFYAPMAPIPNPIPSAIFLFGSMFIGLFGLLRRNANNQALAA